jgi:Domain of unknown function (DUF5655)/Domain of unknown function (DUF4287)
MAKTGAARTKSLYGVHPGVVMVEKWAAELKEKSGRSVDEWVALVKKQGAKDEKGRREWLKTKHGLGTNGATWIARRAGGQGGEDSDPESYLRAAAQYVEEQYAGPKQKLRPIFDALLAKGKALGADVKACPCKTIVPLYRQHVFAQIKPTTNARVDLGLALAQYSGKIPGRVMETGGLAKRDRITHRIEISKVEQIDDEVERWLKIAYELDASGARTRPASAKFY